MTAGSGASRDPRLSRSPVSLSGSASASESGLDVPSAHLRVRELLEAQARDAWAQGWSEIRCQVRLAHRRVVTSFVVVTSRCRARSGAVCPWCTSRSIAMRFGRSRWTRRWRPRASPGIRDDSASASLATSTSQPTSGLASRCERAMASPHHAVLEPEGVRSYLSLEEDGSSGVDAIEVVTPLRDLEPADLADGPLAQVLGRETTRDPSRRRARGRSTRARRPLSSPTAGPRWWSWARRATTGERTSRCRARPRPAAAATRPACSLRAVAAGHGRRSGRERIPVAFEAPAGRWLGLDWAAGELREVEIRRP